MNGILGFASLLKEHGLANEAQHKYIQALEKCIALLLNIINDIVDIPKMDPGQREASVTNSSFGVEKLQNNG